MKKKWIVIALAACAIALAGCKVVSEPEPIAVESVTLSETTLSLAPGDTRKLTATVKPDNADYKSVKWLSSNVEVAMVSSDGTVGAIKLGTTIITAQAGDKTAICVITVNDAAVVNPDSPVAVDSITLSATTLTIEPGKTRELKATVMPSNADDKTITWSSSDEGIATVSDDGTITAHAEGTATITARAGGKKATCTVTVKTILIPVERVTLNMTTLTLTRGDTGKLVATVTPDNADDTSVAWTSSNSDVATVGNDGTVTAVKVGTTIIIAQAGDITAVCTVTVNPILVKNISLDAATLTLAPDMERKLTAAVTPSNADDTTVAWVSSNSDVATVSNDGTVKAVNAGTATITAQSGDITAECIVTVHTDHTYSGGKCTLCGAKPYMENGTIDDNGVLTKYSGSAATVTIPDGVTGIGWKAFSGRTGLTSVEIPNSVTSIDGTAFSECTIKNVTYKVTLAQWCAMNGAGIMMYAQTVTLEDVKDLKSLTQLVIPKGVTSIGNCAFYNCTNLTSVTIPNSVTSIESSAFYNCTNLTSVIIPDSVTSIGFSVFYNCTSLTSVTIPNSVTSIGSSAFYNCTSLTNVTIPSNVTSIEYATFNYCTNLKTVTIPNSVTIIEAYAFSGSGLADVTIPGSVTSIDKFAFSLCTSLTSVTISEGVTSIGEGAFGFCSNLTNVKIPKSVTSIGSDAFKGCTLLTVRYSGTEDEWKKIEGSSYSNLSNKTILYNQ